MAPASMQSAVLVAPRRFELRHGPVPAPGPRQVRVRLEGCGVCGSNLPVWQGRPWFTYPLPAGAPGHEAWGRIDAVGSEVEGLARGDRVAGLCDRGFADYALFAGDEVVSVPAALDHVPAPGEPLACAVNILERSDVGAGHTVAVIGIGFLGALLVQQAARTGARVVAVSRRPHSLELARRMGAWRTLALDGTVVDQIEELTGGELCQRVIEVTGAQEALDLAGKLTATRGRLVIAGFHQDGPRQVDLCLWNWRGLDVVNAHERDPARYVEGMRRAFDRLANGCMSVGDLFTHRAPLEHIDRLFARLEDRGGGFVKGLVMG